MKTLIHKVDPSSARLAEVVRIRKCFRSTLADFDWARDSLGIAAEERFQHSQPVTRPTHHFYAAAFCSAPDPVPIERAVANVFHSLPLGQSRSNTERCPGLLGGGNKSESGDGLVIMQRVVRKRKPQIQNWQSSSLRTKLTDSAS